MDNIIIGGAVLDDEITDVVILTGLIRKTGEVRVNLNVYNIRTDKINQTKVDQAISYLMNAERIMKEIKDGHH